MVFRIRPFDEADVIARRLATIRYAVYAARGAAPPSFGDGAGVRLITMDAALAEMPDAVWLRRMFPNAAIAFRSNNREVQARLCAEGAGLAVLPRPLGDVIPGIAPLALAEQPPMRNTYVGYHRDLRRLRRLRALLDLIVERIAN
jgi:DNA-binding transcriptional LysR family regulator